MALSDAVRRAIRTFIDAWFTLFALLALPALGKIIADIGDGHGEFEIDLNFWGNVLIASTAAGLIALVNFVKNWLEDNVGWFPALFKSQPSAGLNPVTTDPPK